MVLTNQQLADLVLVEDRARRAAQKRRDFRAVRDHNRALERLYALLT